MSRAASPASTDDCFRLAMSTSGIGMATAGLDGRWREVNPVLAAMLGAAAAELVGQSMFDWVHPDDVDRARQALEALVAGRLPTIDARERYRRRDGGTLWVHTNAAVMRDAGGAPCFLVMQVRDVSAEHEARELLQSRQHERAETLSTSQRQLQLFADAVAHDLRAPLRSIESFSRLLDQRVGDTLDPASRDHLDRIRAAASRMGSLLTALGELSHATRAELRPGPVDFTLLADWIIAELQEAEPAREARVTVQPGLAAEGDERLLKVALCQLLHNAWKFTPAERAVEIDVTGGVDGAVMRVSVRDGGRGFDARYSHKMFDPFQRLHGPEEGGGHGLGLAIADCIIRRHDGRIRAESEPGVGSRFHIELPAGAG